MAPRSFLLDDALATYLLAHNPAPDSLLERLAAETRELGSASGMQIGPEQGAFMALLAQISGARTAVELGTFTGYSALCVARALPADGSLLCCDVSEEWTAVARRYWAEAGVADKITLKIGPAAQTLAALPAEPTFDLAFVDADKTAYAQYWELLLPRMHAGGLLVIDNVLQSGEVVDEAATDSSVVAVRAFNDAVASDDRVDAVLLAVADGLTLARVKA